MKLRHGRAAGARVAVAVAFVFGAAGLSACDGDDGATLRNLNEEEPIGADAFATPSAPTSGAASGEETAKPSALPD